MNESVSLSILHIINGSERAETKNSLCTGHSEDKICFHVHEVGFKP